MLEANPKITMEEIEESMGGNLCRCTGYRPILDAFKSFASDKSTDLEKKVGEIEVTLLNNLEITFRSKYFPTPYFNRFSGTDELCDWGRCLRRELELEKAKHAMLHVQESRFLCLGPTERLSEERTLLSKEVHGGTWSTVIDSLWMNEKVALRRNLRWKDLKRHAMWHAQVARFLFSTFEGFPDVWSRHAVWHAQVARYLFSTFEGFPDV